MEQKIRFGLILGLYATGVHFLLDRRHLHQCLWFSKSISFTKVASRKWTQTRRTAALIVARHPFYPLGHLNEGFSFLWFFVGVHEFSSRLTTFSSCRRQGSNRWPLDHKSNAPFVPWGTPIKIIIVVHAHFYYVLYWHS